MIPRKLKILAAVCLVVVLGVLIQSYYVCGLTTGDSPICYSDHQCDYDYDGQADCYCSTKCPEGYEDVGCGMAGISFENLPKCNDCPDELDPSDFNPPSESSLPDVLPPTNDNESEDTTSPTPEKPTVKFGGYNLALTQMLKVGTFQEPETSLLVHNPETERLTILGDVLVDTGADVTLLPLRVAKGLGYDLNSLDKVELGVVGGTDYGYEGASIEIGIVQIGGIEEDLDGYILGKDGEPLIWEIPVVFLPSEAAEESILLGRQGVLDKIKPIFVSENMVKIKVKED